jgi:diguanylate cyclase (GGDEF)-like protein
MKPTMDLFHDENLPLKVFVDVLGQKYASGHEADLSWIELEKTYGPDIYRDILFLLTHVELETEDAQVHWALIQEHREALGRQMGRDPGLQVAVCDYFVNFGPQIKDMVLVEVHRLLQKERFALVDELTGLYNRRFFNQMMTKEIENARRTSQPFSLLVLDIDHFKCFNDTLGHHAGDQALVELAEVLSRTARAGDHLARYGGEEFVVILPRTDKRQALIAAQRYRRAVERHPFPGQECQPNGNMTISIGVATFPDDGSDAALVFRRADAALYDGKHQGRNRVVCHEDDKRSHPRFPVLLDLLFRQPGSTPQFSGPCKTRNVSLAGALCQHDQPVGLGADLEVLIRNGGRREVTLNGRVVRLSQDPADKSYYLGISFKVPSREVEQNLWTLIQENAGALH